MSRIHVFFVSTRMELFTQLASGFEGQRFQVTIFDSVPDASSQIRWLPPEVLLIDFDISEQRGETLIQELRNHFGDEAPPIIAITQLQDESSISRAYELGVTDVIHVPLSIPHLSAKITHLARSFPCSRSIPKADIVPAQIDGYKIRKELGRGGMGVVYEAVDPQNNSVVAIKTMFGSPENFDALLRFRREIDLLVNLNHPNLIRMIKSGRCRDVFYYVMEFCAGRSLDGLIADRGPMPPTTVAALLCAIADGLSYIHELGLVHRDIKPANVLLKRDRGPILSDFGLSKSLRDAQLTGTNQLVGTPHYMAPEYIRGEPYSPASDLFSLGMVGLEAILGDLVFPCSNSYTVMEALARGDFPTIQDSLKRVGSYASSDLIQIFQSMLELNPANRPASTRELRDALRRWLPGSWGDLFSPSSIEPSPLRRQQLFPENPN